MKIYVDPHNIPEMANIPAAERSRVWRVFMKSRGSAAKGSVVGLLIFLAFFISGAFVAESLADSHVYLSFIVFGLFSLAGLAGLLHTLFSFQRKPFQEFCASHPTILIREPLPDLEPYPRPNNWPISPIQVAQLIGVLKLTSFLLSPFLVFAVCMTFSTRNMNAMVQFGVDLGWDPRTVVVGVVLSLVGVPVLYGILISLWLKRTDFVKKTKNKYHLDGKRYSLRWLHVASAGTFSFISFVSSLVAALLSRSYQMSGQFIPVGHEQSITFRQGYLIALLFLVVSVVLAKAAWDFARAPEERD